MLPVLQAVGIVSILAALVFSLVPLVVLGLFVYKLSQIAEYNRQTVQALGRIDARLEEIESRDRPANRGGNADREKRE